jgi:hypothetical protein
MCLPRACRLASKVSRTYDRTCPTVPIQTQSPSSGLGLSERHRGLAIYNRITLIEEGAFDAQTRLAGLLLFGNQLRTFPRAIHAVGGSLVVRNAPCFGTLDVDVIGSTRVRLGVRVVPDEYNWTQLFFSLQLLH